MPITATETRNCFHQLCIALPEMTPMWGLAVAKTPATPESVTFQRCVPFAVEIGVTETHGSDAGTFHVEADIELVRHAHAAMHLQTLIRHQRRDFGEARLGDARDLRDIVAPVLDGGQ